MMRRSHTVSAGWRSMSTRKNIRLCDLQSCVSLCRGSGQRIYRRVWNTLKPGGIFLLNIEHPVFTAGVREDWIYDEKGRAMYWPVDDYYYPGERITLSPRGKCEKVPSYIDTDSDGNAEQRVCAQGG